MFKSKNDIERDNKKHLIMNRIKELKDDALINALYELLKEQHSGLDLSCAFLNNKYNEFQNQNKSLVELKNEARECKTLCDYLLVLFERHGINRENDAKTFNSITNNCLPNHYNKIVKDKGNNMKKISLLSILICIGCTYEEACLAFEFADYKIEKTDPAYIFLLKMNKSNLPDIDVYNAFLKSRCLTTLGEQQR